MGPLEKIRDSVVGAAKEGARPNDMAALLLKMSAHVVQATQIADKEEWLECAIEMWYEVREGMAEDEEAEAELDPSSNVINVDF